ncbi:unnamed protein product [Peniophora sp. CBMAI 1063]|nr:unnamed protein product [Peniophora sp. CBMAI 1063]
MESTSSNAPQTAGAAKRRRVDEPEDAVPPPYTPEKYKDMCFEDATILLHCLPSSIAFRVHRGVLAVHSEVFRDMFALAQPSDSGPENTLPVVHMHDDPEKLYRLLKYIYLHQLPDMSDARYMDTLLDMLEPSIKYDVRRARDDCLSALRAEFPDTLSKYHEAIETLLRRHLRGIAQCLRCVDVFTRHECWTLLPAVYASSAMFQIPPGTLHEIAPDYPSARTMAAISLGKFKLQRLRLQTVHGFVRDVVQQPAALHCGHKLARIFVNYMFLDNNVAGVDITDPALMFQKNVPLAADVTPEANQLCDQCRHVWRTAEKVGNERAWMEMPAVFGLGTWEELRDKEAKAHPVQPPVDTHVGAAHADT